MIDLVSRRSPSIGLIAPDVLLALCLVVIEAVLVEIALGTFGKLYFYQSYMPEIVYAACGHGLVRPVNVPQPILDFLLLHTTKLDCSVVTPPPASASLGIFTQVHLYLALAVAALWKNLPIDYFSIRPLLIVLAGAYAGGCYVLLRQFFDRSPAFAGGLVLALSPAALSMLTMLRDFSKAPFFIWCIVFLVASARSTAFIRTVIQAALAGAVVGLGYGFRSDVIILLPIGMMFLAIGVPGGWWRPRLVVVAAFLAAGLIVASPILMSRNSGGFGSVLMQGMSEPFRVELGLGEAPYMLGQRYSDELTFSSIAADLSAHDPTWDSREGQAGRSISQAVLRSGPYVLGWLGLFAGDVATQALKSAAWVIGFPTLIAPGRSGLDPSRSARDGSSASRYTIWLYDALGVSWFPFVAMFGLAIFFWSAAASRPREAIALFLTFAALLSYTVVQFSIRHVFHLEFVWVVAALSIVVLPRRLLTSQKLKSWGVLPRFAVCVLGFAVLVAGVRLLLVTYQDAALRGAFTALLAEPREQLAISRTSAAGAAVLNIPVPNRYRALVDGPADSMTNFIGVGAQWSVRAAVDRLLLTIGGKDCHAEKVNLSFRYAKRVGVWQPFDHDVAVDRSPDRAEPTIVLVPAFYRPSQHLAGIQVPESAAACIEKIERVEGATKLPAILSAVLSPGWQRRPLHRAFGGFPVVK